MLPILLLRGVMHVLVVAGAMRCGITPHISGQWPTNWKRIMHEIADLIYFAIHAAIGLTWLLVFGAVVLAVKYLRRK